MTDFLQVGDIIISDNGQTCCSYLVLSVSGRDGIAFSTVHSSNENESGIDFIERLRGWNKRSWWLSFGWKII